MSGTDNNIPDTDWRLGLKVAHPETMQEPLVMREARVLRTLDAFLRVNGNELNEKTRKKLQKTINVALINIMDQVRDAAP